MFGIRSAINAVKFSESHDQNSFSDSRVVHVTRRYHPDPERNRRKSNTLAARCTEAGTNGDRLDVNEPRGAMVIHERKR